MDIAVISHNLSTNGASRAYMICQLLSNFSNVRLIGVTREGEVWGPLKNSSIKIVPIKNEGFFTTFKNISSMIKKNEIVYTMKPYSMSFGIGMYLKLKNNQVWFSDIDDWELGFLFEQDSILRNISYVINIFNRDNLILAELFSYISRYTCDNITVSSPGLHKKYGGFLLPHVHNTDDINPKNYKSENTKKELKVSGKKVIMFMGTPRKHKGIDDLLKAFKLLDESDDAVLLLIGLDNKKDTFSKLKPLKDKVKIIGQYDFDKLAYYLSAADVVVIPQKRSPGALYQSPIKLIDAMAMAKPIVSTNVSNIPDILSDGCGLVVEPGNPKSLAVAIQKLLDNPSLARKMGSNARKKCIKEFSHKAYEKKLQNLLINSKT